jgi:hypothetical protein
LKKYFADWVFSTGLALLVLGNAPLVTIILLARIGLWPDPDPNPIGPGLLCFLTFWPGVILLSLGVRRVRRRQGGHP